MEVQSVQSLAQSTLFNNVASELGVSVTDPRFPTELDSRDPLAHFRDRFCIPSIEELLDGRDIPPGQSQRLPTVSIDLLCLLYAALQF